MSTVGVFSSSSRNLSPLFYDEAARLGECLARAGYTIVYGGGTRGAMGHLALRALECGGEVIGVTVRSICEQDEYPFPMSQHIEFEALYERKQKMIELSDAFLFFPGGIGTLDEVFEVLTLKQTGHIDKTIVFYDFLDFWQPTLESLEIMAEQGFIPRGLDHLFLVAKTPRQALTYLEAKNT